MEETDDENVQTRRMLRYHWSKFYASIISEQTHHALTSMNLL